MSYSIAVWFACLALVAPSDAYAYIDPGSGSFLLQMIIAGLLAASFMIKTWWRQIKATFTRWNGKHNKREHDAS